MLQKKGPRRAPYGGGVDTPTIADLQSISWFTSEMQDKVEGVICPTVHTHLREKEEKNC